MVNSDIHISKINESYVKVSCDYDIALNISDYFSIYAKNFFYHPKYKNKSWDGKVRLFNMSYRTLPVGLVSSLYEFASDYGYSISGYSHKCNKISKSEMKSFIESLDLRHDGNPMDLRDFQFDAILTAAIKKRIVLLSPTATGKSAIIYGATRFYQNATKGKILIVVPSTGLVEQMYSDFDEYSNQSGWASKNVHRIYAGKHKNTKQGIYISTWQSLVNIENLEYFNQFSAIIVDEVHGADAKSLTHILNGCKNARYRLGCTGTLKDSKVSESTLVGLFGDIHVATTSKVEMEKGVLSDIDISMLILEYGDDVRESMSNAKYAAEMDFLCKCKERNDFLVSLPDKLSGNTLMLFQYVEKHGKILYDLMEKKYGKKYRISYIHGGTPVEQRRAAQQIAEKYDNSIIIASYGVFSQGINIRRLHNIIFCTSGKSKVRVLQSIGRGLRTHKQKSKCNLYDISDDLSYKSWKNYSMRHFSDRLKLYKDEGWSYKIHKIDIS